MNNYQLSTGRLDSGRGMLNLVQHIQSTKRGRIRFAIPRPQLSMKQLFGLGFGVGLGLLVGVGESLALPPPDDIPEEVLRNEIILEGRSPLDGELLTAAEYAELQDELSQPQAFIELDPSLERLVFLLHLRKTLNTLIPFANF